MRNKSYICEYCETHVHEQDKKLEAAEARIVALKEALTLIAAWHEGPVISTSFDEPSSARIARALRRGHPSGASLWSTFRVQPSCVVKKEGLRRGREESLTSLIPGLFSRGNRNR